MPQPPYYHLASPPPNPFSCPGLCFSLLLPVKPSTPDRSGSILGHPRLPIQPHSSTSPSMPFPSPRAPIRPTSTATYCMLCPQTCIYHSISHQGWSMRNKQVKRPPPHVHGQSLCTAVSAAPSSSFSPIYTWAAGCSEGTDPCRTRTLSRSDSKPYQRTCQRQF